MKLKYGVIGVGALGGFYGGNLARAGNDVHFLFHSDYDYAKAHGLKIDSVNGDFHLSPVNAYKNAADMPPCDVILICLKTTGNHLLKQMLPPVIHKNSVAILVQNGLGFEEKLAADFPGLAIAGGLAFICSTKVAPGHIVHMDYGKITIGAYNDVNPEIVGQIVSDFKNAGIEAEKSDDLNKSRWQKLVWNIPYNGMTVVLNTTTDKLMNHPNLRALIRDLMDETVEAAAHCGAPLSEGFAQRMMESTDNMRPYAPSMKIDFDMRRPMEIEAIYGNPAKKAAEAGFDMKKTAMLEQQLQFIQSDYLK